MIPARGHRHDGDAPGRSDIGGRRGVPSGVVRALTRLFGRVGLVLALVAAAGTVSLVVADAVPDRADAAGILGSGGEYHPIAPRRILDTRQPNAINDLDRPGPKAVTPGAGSTFEVQVLGQGGLPPVSTPASVLAVAVTITVVDPTTSGYLQAWGTGNQSGESSIVNFRRGENVPNMAILVPGSAGGKVTMKLVADVATAGTAHVLMDVVGWFSTSSHGAPGARLLPVDPARVFDSRQAPRRAPIGPQEAVQVTMRGRGGVPDSSTVSAVLVNITGVNDLPGSTTTFVSALPARPGGVPSTSTLNLVRNQVKANLSLVPLGADGTIHLYNQSGSAHLIVDVVAYLQPNANVNSRAGRVVPLVSPFRVLDTRQAAFGATPLVRGRGEDWSFAAFAADVRLTGEIAAGAQSGFLGNLTGTELTRTPDWFTPVTTFLTIYPTPPDRAPGTPPEISNLNLGEGVSVPNMALLKYGGPSVDTCGTVRESDRCQVRFYNYNGLLHYIVDASAVILAD